MVSGAVTGGIVVTEVAAIGAVAGTEAAAISTSAMVSGASAVGRGSRMVSGAGAVGRGSRYFGRVGTTAASSARFIPIAGGLLSAACVVYEGKELKRTLSKIREGNPCEKAEQVRSIKDEVGMLPDSSLIAAECRRVFELAQQEKLKKAALADSASDGNQQEKKEGNLTLDDVDSGDISDMISVMETSTTNYAMKENAIETDEMKEKTT
mmetsp:Transcript_21182/g.38351  ORF Transcript_21182/g.38351 Transcript_21182/m.38351 type:complete len:209 (+) Transcript_21182:1-627(+)